MKQKDFVLLGGVVVVAAIFSLVISNYLFAAPANRQQTVEVIAPINATFTTPSTAYFNSSSIDPTQTIQVNINTNQQPFGAGTAANSSDGT